MVFVTVPRTGLDKLQIQCQRENPGGQNHQSVSVFSGTHILPCIKEKKLGLRPPENICYGNFDKNIQQL